MNNKYVCPSCGAALDSYSIAGKGADICDFCGATVVADSSRSDAFNREKLRFEQDIRAYGERIAAKEAFLSKNKKKYGSNKAARVFLTIALIILIVMSGLLTVIVFMEPIVLMFAVPSVILLLLTVWKLKRTKSFIKSYEEAEVSRAMEAAAYNGMKDDYEKNWVLK